MTAPDAAAAREQPGAAESAGDGPAVAPALVVAVAQFAPGPDVAANLASIGDLVRAAVARGADLVVLPEYSSFFRASMDESYLAAAEALEGPFTAGLRELAEETGAILVAGLVERLDDDLEHFANTLVAVAPGRGIVATYRKQHLYDAFGGTESRFIRPGGLGEPQTFVAGGLIVGMQTCYDIRFPEVTRRLVDAGAELVLVPAEWVRGPLKEHHWRTLVTARAIENTVFVAAADHTPPVGVGTSLIVDPMGVAVAEIGEQPGIAVASVSRDRIAEVRAVNPALRLRRYRVVPVGG